ncbi:MarR family winged helix-turn-helix transcriptional regulator [Marisediminicola sp. LYQ134]|uniref:MarR family winged helix-turn-helix transcriptional regulator n=1 Tax=unclassified Marisediminicola TaxID=2618316 RepID=UPI00398318B4
MPHDDHELRLTILRLARRIRLMQADESVTEGQRTALFQLHRHGPQTLGSLSALERVSPPSMNRTVGALVDAGLVTRVTDSDDARRVTIALSVDGDAFVAETRRRRDEWFTRRLHTLAADERQLLLDATPILARLADE